MPAQKRKVKKKRTRQARRKQRKQALELAMFLPSRQTVNQLSLLLLALTLILGLNHFYQWLMRPDTLPFKQVTVSGELQHLDTEKLRAVIAAGVNGGFFSLSLKQLQTEIEQMSWVNRVSLRRDWPDRLRIYIDEQVPIAKWQTDKYLNRYGKIFAPAAEVEPELELPSIQGVNGREIALLEGLVRYNNMLMPVDLVIKEIEEDARHDQHLLLDNGMQLVLGRDDREIRLQRFVNIYARTLAPVASKISSLDLRYSNGFSVQWHEHKKVNLKAGNGHA